MCKGTKTGCARPREQAGKEQGAETTLRNSDMAMSHSHLCVTPEETGEQQDLERKYHGKNAGNADKKRNERQED